MVRYPDKATLQLTSSTKDVDGNFTGAILESEIVGRFRPIAKGSLDYAGKFYCKKLDFAPYEIEGEKLKVNGVVMEIYKFYNYQNHCELWLR